MGRGSGAADTARLSVLDGWRALSILLVLAGHLLPLGPKSLELNAAVAATGMAVFFILSGFLITRFMLDRPEVRAFLIRRLFRILPLAWTAMIVLAIADRADGGTIAHNLLFVSNLPPTHLLVAGEHLWSLCVEVQFYLCVALLVGALGRRALYLLPLFCLTITAIRIAQGAEMSIYTWQRIDEILAGAGVALAYSRGWLNRDARWAAHLPVALLALLLVSAHPWGGALNYLRPYIAAAMVAASLVAMPRLMRRLFESRAARYVAEVSYALYVLHGMLAHTWLGAGDTLAKYLKRPLLFAATFAAAHLSTFHFEHPLVAVSKRLTRRR